MPTDTPVPTATATNTPLPDASRVITYTYDGLDRLIRAIESPGTTYAYGYDLAGNRTSVTVNGTTTTTSYNAANQVIGLSYDAAGNLLGDGTTTYGYDALGRMTARGSTSYTYNGDGVLVFDGSTRYTQDLAAPLSQILSDGTSTYFYGTERLFAQQGTTQTWYSVDALGSVRRTVSAAGVPQGVVNYDPWGVPETGSVPTFGFTGELQAGSDVYLRARWYHAGRGVFGGRDPFAGMGEQPYSLHPYQYAYADPVLHRDPSGRCIPENIAGLGEEGCQFLGWNPMEWNWADGRAYYYGTPGTIGKMALMALFPPAAFVYGAENAALSYIRYNENPTECNGVFVVVDTVLAVLPFASLAKITGGAGPMLGGGGALVLNAAQTRILSQEVAAVAVGAGYIPNVFYARRQGSSDPSGQQSGGGSGTQTGSTSENARILRKNMLDAGKIPNSGDAAHHIVHSTHSYIAAQKSREILARYGIDINDAVNGVFVSVSQNSRFNAYAYMDKVNSELLAASSKQDVIDILNDVYSRILSNSFYP